MPRSLEEDRLQHTRAELAVEQAALYRLIERLHRAEKLPDIYEAALDAILEALGTDRASILLFDTQGVMRFVAWRGLSPTYRAAVEGHTPWKPSDHDPEPICVPDIETSTESEAIKRSVRTEGIRGLCFMPLVSHGAVIGKFMAYYRTPHAFMDEEIALCREISRQLGFSIERQRAEQARATLAAIVTSSNDAIISEDLDGFVSTWNAGAERIFGYRAEEVIGKPITLIIPTERQAEEDNILSRSRRGEATGPFESLRRRKDGSGVEVAVTVSPIRDARGAVIGASTIVRDITDRKRQERQQITLMNELNHRVKNTLTTIQAIASQTLRHSSSIEQAERQFSGRLVALAKAHEVLTQRSWEGAPLRQIIEQAVAPHCTPDMERFRLDGPDVWLSPKHALAMTLALHELCTNASKYGALSTETGRVDITWSLAKSRLRLSWQEVGGPLVSAPPRRGFGSRLLERGVGYDLDGAVRLEFEPSGVFCAIEARLATQV